MKQWMKAAALLLCLLLAAFALAGCGEKKEPPAESDAMVDGGTETEEPAENSGIGMPQRAEINLLADFSNGNPLGKTLEIAYKVDAATMEGAILSAAEGLSEWTGLDFTLNSVTVMGHAVLVDWALDSSLLGGLDERMQKDEFSFFDAVSLNWFMMDSLASTIKESFLIETVYYSMDGGKELAFSAQEDMALQGLPELPIDQPYEGSAFFVSHADGKGE